MESNPRGSTPSEHDPILNNLRKQQIRTSNDVATRFVATRFVLIFSSLYTSIHLMPSLAIYSLLAPNGPRVIASICLEAHKGLCWKANGRRGARRCFTYPKRLENANRWTSGGVFAKPQKTSTDFIRLHAPHAAKSA